MPESSPVTPQIRALVAEILRLASEEAAKAGRRCDSRDVWRCLYKKM